MLKKLVIATAIGIPTVWSVNFYWKILTSEIALFEMFPDVPQKDIIRAHRQMLRDLLTLKFDGRGFTDAQWYDKFTEYLAATTK